MFEVRGKKIQGDPIKILESIRKHLQERTGKVVLQKFKPTFRNIQFTCPMPHENGYEKNPSCGIATETFKQGDLTVKGGTIHCFTCGYTASLDKMISDVMEIPDNGDYGYSWLVDNVDFLQGRKLDLSFSRGSTKEDVQTYVPEEVLDTYRYTHPYMYKRGLTDEIIELYDIGFDKNSNSITFPVRDTQGRTLFVSRRSVDTKWFNNPTSSVKPLYGLYEIPKDVKVIYICESFFDVHTVRKYGGWAIGLMGTGDYSQYDMLNRLGRKTFILALDGDSAGDKGKEKLLRHLDNNKLVFDLQVPRGKDINDLTEEEFNNLEKILRTY